MTTTATRPPSQLLGPEHDTAAPVEPITTYIICTTPRSGSNLLCDRLTATGILGTPTEYLELNVATAYLAVRWGASNLADYLHVLREKRTGPNGVFANKILWRQLVILDKKIRNIDGTPTVGETAATMNLIFPQAHFVYLTREDRIGQAVSLFKAFGTGQWSSYFERRSEPPAYDFASVLAHYRSLVWEDTSWESFFQLTATSPLRLKYSQVVSDPLATVSAVAKHIEVEAPLTELPAPTLTRQRDAWNSETRERFEADLIARGADSEDPGSILGVRL